MPRSAQEITNLLKEWSGGNQTALEQLLPLVHEELRRLAHQYMQREEPGHMLQTTALVNEAFKAGRSKAGELAEPIALLRYCRPVDAPHPG